MATPWKIRRTVDLEKWEQKAEHLGILAFTGAKNAHQMILTVFENDQPVSFASATNVMAYFIRAGEKVTIKCSVTANVITFRFPAAAYAIQTRVSVLVCAENTDEKVPLYAAVFDPGNGSENVIIDPDDVIPDVSKVLAQVEAAEEAAAAANQAAANAQKFADEANTAAAEALKAAENAGGAEKSANDAAHEANAAADAANEAAVGASAWAKATMEAESLPEGSAPTISVEKNENGGNVIRVGIPAGKTGDTGEIGVTPQITFEVETGAAGSDVKVEQSGTAEAPHIKLTIPRGDTGAVEGIDYYEGDPAPLGTASPGTSNGLARGNHVHPMPTAEQVGARSNTWIPTAEDVGALGKNETAANATQLNGKDAKYYSRPRNLLDNSNFEIAQAGYNGTHGTVTYACDRWIASEGTVVTKTETGLLLSAGGAIRQKQTGLAGKTLTFAAKGIAEASKSISFVNADYEGLISEWFSEGIGVCTYTMPSNEDEVWLYVSNESGDDATFEWAALYEGEYTSDNLPPYVPKENEIVACLQYAYIPMNSQFAIPVSLGGYTSITFPFKMRATPTIELELLNGVEVTIVEQNQYGVAFRNDSASTAQFRFKAFADL